MDKALETIAAKLGIAVNVLWAALLRQAFINGLADLLFILFTIGLVFGTVKLWKVVCRKVSDRTWGEESYALAILASVVCLILVIVILSSLPIIFAAFFNPEYWALHKILRTIAK
ncbi:MAG: hypothetical protein U1E51_27305 [Candidatus Binatia bacterium]|nr:hypothetical protein [Candidatus Binatia bacterium]